ncbi:MAG: isoprenyl transferase [Bacteroidales bacterium]|nr:isoprenyl transferase [Bacteroidales bacterium]
MLYKDKIDKNKIPNHVAIIMDGNGRWAKQRNKLRIFGHQRAVKSVREVTEAAAEIGIKYLTLYAFSTENWGRPKEEVNALMTLLVRTINMETKTLNKNDIRLLAIGDLKSLPNSCYKELQKAMKNTENNKRMSLVLALSYGSRWEIVNAMKKIADDMTKNKIKKENINEDLLNLYLNTCNIPDPELLIRTSGEYRVSNFLLWQIAYSELYFTAKLWPDFKKEDFYEALVDFQNRQRRFGLTSEQVIRQS